MTEGHRRTKPYVRCHCLVLAPTNPNLACARWNWRCLVSG